MALEDESKTSFITPFSVYCYVWMPFGLWNAGATFSLLVHKVLQQQLGHNAEAHVDDIVVKSQLKANHVADLQETFNSLRAAGIRQNPEKCVFGARGRKMLGYLVSRRGIMANPGKIHAIAEMSPPTNPKEVQRLVGHLVVLSCFLTKSSEHSLPFFKMLSGSEPFS